MENQHRKIKGYRELSAEEIALMNAIKEKGIELGNLLNQVSSHVANQYQNCKLTSAAEPPDPEKMAERNRLEAAEPEQWVKISKQRFQEGLMALTRAVAQPTFF